MAKVKSRNQYTINHLILVAVVSAVVGIVATAYSSARQGNTVNSNVSIGGVSTCKGSAWTVDARAYSGNVALMNVDIYDTPYASSSAFHLVASDVSLPVIGDPYTFQTHPEAGVKKYDMVAVGHGGNPNQKELLGAARYVNPCM